MIASNKAPKSDKVKLSCLLQKAQKPRQLHFAPWQRRYVSSLTTCNREKEE
jgi:hypothetical protein